jgi:ribosomal protein L14E/L6E/L27E
MIDKFTVGGVVKATLGRERNQLFIIKSVDDNFAYIINGKSRTIDKPKRKNKKHLYCLLYKSDLVHCIEDQTITNAQVIKYLKDYTKSLGK